MPKKRKSPPVAKKPERFVIIKDELTGRERKTILLETLSRLMVESLDKLPGPAEFRGYVGRGKKRRLVRLCKSWVGFGWTDGGEATGKEPLLVLDDTLMTSDEFEVARVHAS
jgi:hypothetical protein